MNIRLGVLASISLALPACGGGGSGGGSPAVGEGTISLAITDAPFELDIVSEAEIAVDRITVYRECGNGSHHDGDDDRDDDRDHEDDEDGAGNDDDGDDECDPDDAHPIVVYQGPPIVMNLLELRDGLTRDLAERDLPAGEYRLIRLHLVSARLLLINGNTYTTQDGTLRLNGHGQQGFRICVDPPFVVTDGGMIRALLDFDLTKSFVPHPHSDHLNAEYYRLKAKIRAVNLSTTGGMHGIVVRPNGTGGADRVADATVHVLPPGETEPDLGIASTGTSSTGTFAVFGLAPGTYDVLAVKDGVQGFVHGVSVGVGGSTFVEVLIASPPSGDLAAIHGVVYRDGGGGSNVPAEGATVYMLPPGESNPANAIASDTVGSDGAYLIEGLPPGTYDVLTILDGLANIQLGVVLAPGASLELDITIQ